jgi:hypothetical protein
LATIEFEHLARVRDPKELGAPAERGRPQAETVHRPIRKYGIRFKGDRPGAATVFGKLEPWQSIYVQRGDLGRSRSAQNEHALISNRVEDLLTDIRVVSESSKYYVQSHHKKRQSPKSHDQARRS